MIMKSKWIGKESSLKSISVRYAFLLLYKKFINHFSIFANFYIYFTKTRLLCYYCYMIEKLEEIITSSSEYRMLAGELESGKLAKTIMLISKDSDYSFEFARLLSCMIFNNGLNNGILEKSESYLKVKASTHPDLKVFPIKDKLLVADSGQIVEESAIKPIFSERKVFIIKNFEASMEAAQNKLLKTLEEPQSNVYFILTTSNVNLVLPTIRSRCNKIELGRLDRDKIEQCIGNIDNLQMVTALSEGYIGKAERLSQNQNLDTIFNSVLSLVTKLKSSKELLVCSKPLIDFSSEFDLIINILSLIFEDLLAIKSGGKVKLEFCKQSLLPVSREYTVKAIVEIRKLIDKAAKEISYNCNFILVIENLLLNILEVKYLCK